MRGEQKGREDGAHALSRRHVHVLLALDRQHLLQHKALDSARHWAGKVLDRAITTLLPRARARAHHNLLDHDRWRLVEVELDDGAEHGGERVVGGFGAQALEEVAHGVCVWGRGAVAAR